MARCLSFARRWTTNTEWRRDRPTYIRQVANGRAPLLQQGRLHGQPRTLQASPLNLRTCRRPSNAVPIEPKEPRSIGAVYCACWSRRTARPRTRKNSTNPTVIAMWPRPAVPEATLGRERSVRRASASCRCRYRRTHRARPRMLPASAPRLVFAHAGQGCSPQLDTDRNRRRGAERPAAAPPGPVPQRLAV